MANRGDGRTLGGLLRDLADGTVTLVRDEIRLARLEVGEAAHGGASGVARLALGGTLALLGVLAVIAGIILLAGDQWLRDRYWLAALILTVLLGIAAALLARRGIGMLSPHRLVPDQTLATLSEDKEWLKRQLTSGATSS